MTSLSIFESASINDNQIEIDEGIKRTKKKHGFEIYITKLEVQNKTLPMSEKFIL